MTRFPVVALRSVELDTPDIAKSEAFYPNVWGLTVATRDGDAVYLHATGDDHHVLVLRFVHGDARRQGAQAVANQVLRLAHVNINSTDVDVTAGFYERVLGFRLSDRSKVMAFARCNSDHHAVVIADAPHVGLNHVAFLMPDLESVMRGSGRLIDHGFPIGWGVGRHGPGDNVFAYFVDPLGFVVEYTAEVLQVDDSYRVRGQSEWTWPAGRTDHWGIAPSKPDHVKQAQLAIPFA